MPSVLPGRAPDAATAIRVHREAVHGEFERLKAAGATVVQKPYQPDEDPEGLIATFADPDDNYFQLLSPFPG